MLTCRFGAGHGAINQAPAALIDRLVHHWFETPVGRQAQADFAGFRMPWAVRYALLVVPGYSRLLWCRFYPLQDMATLMGWPR